MAYLHFVTLNSGAVERTIAIDEPTPPPAVADLERALRDKRAPIAEHPGYEIRALTVGSALLCTIYRGSDLALTTFGVAGKARRAADLWRMLHDTSKQYGFPTDPEAPPPVPWCAVRVEPGIKLDPYMSWEWLTSYELDVAWAWVEKKVRDV